MFDKKSSYALNKKDPDAIVYGWRKSWKRIAGSPARFNTRRSIFMTLSGEIGLPVGEGKTTSFGEKTR